MHVSAHTLFYLPLLLLIFQKVYKPYRFHIFPAAMVMKINLQRLKTCCEHQSFMTLAFVFNQSQHTDGEEAGGGAKKEH